MANNSVYTLKKYEVYSWNARPDTEVPPSGHYPLLDLKIAVRNRFIAAWPCFEFEGNILTPVGGAGGLTLREQGSAGEVWRYVRQNIHLVPLMGGGSTYGGSIGLNLYDAEYSPGNVFPEITVGTVENAINESGASPERLAASGVKLVLWVFENV